MFGKTRKDYVYYTCQPQLDRVGNPETYVDHPKAVYVREDALLECVQTFCNERVFGPDRATLLRHQLRGHDSSDRHDLEQRITAIEKSIAEIIRRQNNLLDEREIAPQPQETRSPTPGLNGCAADSPSLNTSAAPRTPSWIHSANNYLVNNPIWSTNYPLLQCNSSTHPMCCSGTCTPHSASNRL